VLFRSHPVLAENVQILSESKNFEAAYDKFLSLIFEAISNREVAAEALATTLEVLRNKTPKIRESHELSSKLDGLIGRLKEPKFDDAAIYEAEDLIATIQEELAASETLGDFDQMPGGMDDDASDISDMAADAGGAAPVININSPLIQIGGSSGSKESDLGLGGEDDLDLGDETEGGVDADGVEGNLEGDSDLDLGEEEPADDDLAALLGGGGGLGEGKNRRSNPFSESRPNHYEMKNKADDDSAHGSDDNSDDDDDDGAKRCSVHGLILKLNARPNRQGWGGRGGSAQMARNGAAGNPSSA
jgi:hypothetical protein